MKKILGDEFSLFGIGYDTLLPTGAAPDVLGTHFAGTTGNSEPIAPNFSFIAPDVSPRPARDSFDTGLISTTAHTSQTDSGAGPQDIIPAATGSFWVSEGPVTGTSQINGAIQAIAVHPTDPNIMYVGSVNGGIWKTTNATAATPHWVPLTDNLPSLSIGALEFDPTDATHQTLIAGIGATSSLGCMIH